jgi:hypothetical protein
MKSSGNGQGKHDYGVLINFQLCPESCLLLGEIHRKMLCNVSTQHLIPPSLFHERTLIFEMWTQQLISSDFTHI